MHLVLVNQYYPPDTAPTGQYLHDLARMLVQRGHAVTVYCSQRAYNGNESYPAEEQLDGVRVCRVRASGFGRRLGVGKLLDYASFYLNLAWRLYSARERPDVVMALTTPPYLGLLVGWIAQRKRIAHTHWIMDIYPDVLAAHGSMSSSALLYRWLGRLTRCELRRSPLVVCLGEDMAARLANYLPPSASGTVLKSLPLWSDPAVRPWTEPDPPAFRAEQGWTEADLVLMYSGNMGRGHRLGEFLRAAQAMKQEPSVHWVFAGGGKRREEVEQALRDDPGLPVRLRPYAPTARLREHLCSADVHLASLDASWQGCMVPSKFQGIFAVGRPVIFVGGPDNSLARWIKDSGGGWVVPENDVPALLDAVAQARNPAERRRRGEAARVFAERHFDRDINLRTLCEWLEACGRAP